MDSDAVQKEKQGSTGLKNSILGCFDGSNGRQGHPYLILHRVRVALIIATNTVIAFRDRDRNMRTDDRRIKQNKKRETWMFDILYYYIVTQAKEKNIGKWGFKRGYEDAAYACKTRQKQERKKGEADVNLVIVYMFVWS
jgi:hypothetical protein